MPLLSPHLVFSSSRSVRSSAPCCCATCSEPVQRATSCTGGAKQGAWCDQMASTAGWQMKACSNLTACYSTCAALQPRGPCLRQLSTAVVGSLQRGPQLAVGRGLQRQCRQPVGRGAEGAGDQLGQQDELVLTA